MGEVACEIAEEAARTLTDRHTVAQAPFLVNQSLLRDPLGETARRERRGLLAVSLLAIAVVKGQMMPAKLTLADMELSTQNQQFLLWLLFWIVVYFVVAFWK